MKIKLESKSMVKWPTPNSFCKSTRIKTSHWKVMRCATIGQNLGFNRFFTSFFSFFWIWQFIFTSIQMMILNHVKCNDYSSCNNMKNSQKYLDQFWEFLEYLFKTSKVVTSFKLVFSHLEMLIKLIHSFTCHSWMYITSQYIGYTRNI